MSEERYRRKLILHKRRKRDRLMKIALVILAAMLAGLGVIIVVLAYCRMAGPLF